MYAACTQAAVVVCTIKGRLFTTPVQQSAFFTLLVSAQQALDEAMRHVCTPCRARVAKKRAFM